MAIVVDTCSLLMIAKNYLPLDDSGSMAAFLEQKFKEKELLLLDAIQQEASQTSKGIVMEKIPFLKDKAMVIKTADMFPPSPKKFDNMVDNNFCIPLLKKRLNEEEYVQQKTDFLNTGDAKIVIYSSRAVHENLLEDYQVMTEETRTPNDGKLFKKLPLLCDFIGITTITAVDYLQQNGFRIER